MMTSPVSASCTSTPGCATPTLPGFRAEIRVRELHAGPGFGRAVEHTRHGVRERGLDRVQQLGRRRRGAGVGFRERRKIVPVDAVLEDARPHRRNAIQARGAMTLHRVEQRRRIRRRARSAPVAGLATRPSQSSSRPCGRAGTCRRCRPRPARLSRRRTCATSWCGATARLPSEGRCSRW